VAEVYAELRTLAGRYLRHERPGHTLDPTGLVHEVCLRLADGRAQTVSDRGHLIGIAARSMRQVLVNHAQRRSAARRGGGRRRVELDPALAVFEARCVDLLALDEALARLEGRDPRLCHVVELRFFGGLSIAEIAVVTGSSTRTVERDWMTARAWLRKELGS
jgi:RNA polymerase sigma factor (TIGR02999 family)